MERYQYGERNQTRMGTVGWACVAAAVVASEVFFEESLSHAVGRGLDNPRYRPLVLGSMAVVNLHLLRALPRHIDPLVGIEMAGKKALEVYRHVK